MRNNSFWTQNFDKMLLLILLLLVMAATVFPVGGMVRDAETLSWLRTLAGTVSGGLLLLITGSLGRPSGGSPSPPGMPGA
jgi:hypothetical protein